MPLIVRPERWFAVTESSALEGHTSFKEGIATQPTFTGTNPNNHNIFYKIDRGAGFNASWRNLAYKRSGAGGSSASTTVTMTDTTGVNEGDYVFGTNIADNAKVVSVDSGTNITVDIANIGTVSGVLVFNQLPNEDPADLEGGFRLKIRVLANTTSTTNLMTYLSIGTLSTAVAQAAISYQLDPGIQFNIEVRDSAGDLITDATEVTVVKDSDTSVLYHAESVTTGQTTFDYAYSGDTTAYVNVLSVEGYEPKTVSPVILGDSDQTLVVQLVDERGKYLT